jgi:hypothetical protein
VRKVVCSIGAGAHAELLALSGETFRIYADRHGYDVDLRTELLVEDRPASWSKVPLVRGLLERYDLVFWIDADAAIVDASRDVADEIGRRTRFAVVAHEYEGQRIPNLGVMVLRRSRATFRFLDAVWARTEFVDHVWWENAAALAELGYTVPADPTVAGAEPVRLVRPSPFHRRVQFLDPAWNSVLVHEADTPRVRHYPGRSQEYRLEHLRADLDALRRA